VRAAPRQDHPRTSWKEIEQSREQSQMCEMIDEECPLDPRYSRFRRGQLNPCIEHQGIDLRTGLHTAGETIDTGEVA
jgi:hypothetical protein